MRILVDTSVWIDFFRALPSRENALLKDCLSRREYLFTAGVIVQEILQGIKDDPQYRSVKEFLFILPRVDTQFDDFVEAADIYRDLRRRGLTIQSPIDCQIAVLAMRNRLSLLHRDSDFAIIARHYPLAILS